MRALRSPLWLALAALLFAAGSAFADAGPACQGHDFSTDPNIKPDFAAHADELVNSEGLLWRIDKAGLAPSYLFGTIHSTNPEAIAIARDAARYVKGAKAVATELGGVLDAEQKMNMGAALLKAALSPAEDTIAGAFDAEDVVRIDAFLREHGYPPEMAHHLKLWFLAAATSLPACEYAGAEAEFLRALLVGRNEVMMERAAPLLAKGGAFIAVGALHLPGKGGLVERARAAGYEVTKVW